MSFLGIDLHGNQFTVAKMVLKDEKVVIRTSTIRFGTEAYRQFLASLSKEDYLLVESSTNAFWFHCLSGRRRASSSHHGHRFVGAGIHARAFDPADNCN